MLRYGEPDPYDPEGKPLQIGDRLIRNVAHAEGPDSSKDVFRWDGAQWVRDRSVMASSLCDQVERWQPEDR